MEKYRWYKVENPKGATSINAFTSGEAEYLKGIGYMLKEVSIYFRAK